MPLAFKVARKTAGEKQGRMSKKLDICFPEKKSPNFSEGGELSG
jgi:hypothetical protein